MSFEYAIARSTICQSNAILCPHSQFQSYQVRKKGIGLVEQKQVILHEEGRMDDGITFSRSQDEEARTAGVIRKCTILFNQFIG